ncbi:hypothetical protein Tco_0246276 [Tanacetum coccineum]
MDTVVAGTDEEIGSVAVGMSGFILEACLGAMEGGSLEVDSNMQNPKDPKPKNTCLCIGVTPDYTPEKAVQQASLEVFVGFNLPTTTTDLPAAAIPLSVVFPFCTDAIDSSFAEKELSERLGSERF